MNDKVVDKLSERLNKSHAILKRDLKRAQDKVYRKLETKLGSITAQLVKEKDSDGVIPVNKSGKIKRELNKFERELREEYEEAVIEVIRDTARKSVYEIQQAFPEEIIDTEAYTDRVVNRVKNIRLDDGLNLNDRFRRNSLIIRQAIETAILYNIMSRKDVTEIIEVPYEEMEKLRWTVFRVVKSEVYTTHRRTVFELLKSLGDNYVIKFTEGNCGRPDHHNHDCWNVAREDRHGLGKGIFTKEDEDIIYPHPSCTSKLQIVSKEG